MNGKRFVDTNILVYAHDRSAGLKHERAQRLLNGLWDSGEGALSTQVLQEVCVNFRRKVHRPLPLEEVRQITMDYSAWEVVTITPRLIVEALHTEKRYRISFWDALIIQAAASCGSSVLYSEDLANRQHYGEVQVVNPFLEAPVA